MESYGGRREYKMRKYEGINADNIWRTMVSELIETPDHESESRCGDTLEFLQCALVISNPRARWILSRIPPYNPAFGLVEFIWIFNGENDSEVPRFWNPQLPVFTGSSKLLHGAYGYRLKKCFGVDQIQRAYLALQSNPNSRQVVLQIWEPHQDLPDEHGCPASKDIPCNVSSLLQVRNGRLYWTQIMRSNDVMLGLPYNIIQFTMFQELFASWLGCELGNYVHISNSMHIYSNCLEDYGLDSHFENTQDYHQALSINITFEETSHHLSEIYKDLIFIARLQKEKSREKIRSHLIEVFCPNNRKNQCRPALFRDMLCVIGSDAARRLGDIEYATGILANCKDNSLQLAAGNWLIRNANKGEQDARHN